MCIEFNKKKKHARVVSKFVYNQLNFIEKEIGENFNLTFSWNCITPWKKVTKSLTIN